MRNRPLIMGVLNVTPDSFSDGGLYLDLEAAAAHGMELASEGADLIDVGGESTRPGAKPVSEAVEIERVLPVIEALRSSVSARLSVDTRRAAVARAALRAGASIINDVSGGSDPEMAVLAKEEKVDIILMHMQGTPQSMQENPSYPRGVVTEVREYLSSRVQAFVEAGVPFSRIWVDPGIGFGKNLEHNLALLAHLEAFQGIGARLVVGTSRKNFLGRLLSDPPAPVTEREPGTIASNLWAYAKGATVFRVHDVVSLRRALTTWEAIDDAGK